VTHPKSAWLEEITSTYDRIRDGDREATTERAMQHAVDQARKHNATWQEIGDAMSTSRQYANKRYGP
jgi:hypothetical protein